MKLKNIIDKYQILLDQKYGSHITAFVLNEDFEYYTHYWETLLLGSERSNIKKFITSKKALRFIK